MFTANRNPPKKKKPDLTLTSSLRRPVEAVELQEMLRCEQETIRQRKSAAGSKEQDVVGLALSGGGIRSATFCFGVLQVLQRVGLFKNVDFLSTVSGGGYTGSAYSAWRLRQVLANAQQANAQQANAQQANAQQAKHAVRVRRNPPPTWDELLPHLRKFSSYLSPTLGVGAPGTWRIIGTMVRNLAIHWLALVAAIVLVFAVLLLSFRFLWAVTVLLALVGIVYVGRGVRQELAGRAYVRECQQRDTPMADCDPLAAKVQGLLQSPHLKLFTGLTLFGLAAAIVVVFTTYPQFPHVSEAPLAALPVGGYLHSFFPSLVSADFTIYLGTRFWIALLLFVLSIALVVAVGFLSEWRWRPRRDFWPKSSWVGFLLIALMVPAAWAALADHNGAFANLAGAVPVGTREVFARSATWSLAGAWSYAWQAGVVLVLFAFQASVIIAVFNDQMDREEREWATRVVSVCLVAALGWTALAALTLGSAKLGVMLYTDSLSLKEKLSGAGMTSVWLAISAWAARIGRDDGAQALVQSTWKRLAVTIGPWVFIAGLIVVTCFASVLLLLSLGSKFMEPGMSPAHIATTVLWSGWYVPTLLVVSLAVFVVAGFILDPNEYSLHGFYRDRLVRSYLGASNADTPAPDSIWNIRTDDLPLRETAQAVTADKIGAPFHIVNTAVNLFGSKDLRVQQRRCDSFVLTPQCCGSWATNYAATPSRLYLGTALAISGGAVSSNAGLTTHGAAIAALMTFFNMRLGYWFGNPRFGALETSKRPPFAPTYLFTEAFSTTNEDRPFVNLSDGGHFDNLGLYELIRRRCRYIIVVDAECDPAYEFSSLAQAIRMVRIDFNVTINIDVQALAPKPGERCARGHWAHGTIKYKTSANDAADSFPDRGLRQDGADFGELLYIKSSILPEEHNGHISADVIEYAKRHSHFPHDTTADQFFTEPQFESYRKLGECIATKMFDGLDAQTLDAVFKPFRPSGPTSANTECVQPGGIHAQSVQTHKG